MAYTQLKTDYKDDVLDREENENIKYTLDNNDDSTVSLTDVSVYEQEGDEFNAAVLNGIGTVVNAIGSDVTTAKSNITTIQGNVANLQTDMTSVKNKTKNLPGKIMVQRGVFDPGAVSGRSHLWWAKAFDTDFASAPTVVASFYGESSDEDFGLLALSVYNTSAFGFEININNAGSATRHPWVTWIAIGIGT